MQNAWMVVLGVVIAGGAAFGQGYTKEQRARRDAIQAAVKAAELEDYSDEARMKIFRKAMSDAGDFEQTRKWVLEMASHYKGKSVDPFLTEVLKSEEDGGVRSAAAMYLGKAGSAEALAVLLDTAGNDKQTEMMMGDVGMQMSARRASIFAVAELAERFPEIKEKAAAGLRKIEVPNKGFESETLGDAKEQALFQITGDKTILDPFLKKLSDAKAAVRIEGVVAFRFFKLKEAPKELVAALKDPDKDVRSWTALVLGEIGDVKTIDALKAAAADAKEDRNVRGNAQQAIEQMKRAATPPKDK